MKKKITCIIPARGGSKRIKNKNIILFNKKPMISYSINAAAKSKLFKQIIVSTDNEKIKNVAEKIGAKVPFLRQKKISDSKTGLLKVFLDSVKRLNINDGYVFFILATAPLLKAKDLIDAFKKIKTKKADCLIAVSDFDYNPLRGFCYNKNSFIKFKWPRYKNTNSQNLRPLFHDTGTFYIYKVKSLLKFKSFLPKKTIPYFLKRYNSVDIDTKEDLKFAELVYRFRKKND
tara:strand:- start:1150 stop:1842 length:693 start_codon:yes stop_codon:yes gene_type:complete